MKTSKLIKQVQPDYYQLCLGKARKELERQVQSLIQHCAESTESNEAEAIFLAASKIESLMDD